MTKQNKITCDQCLNPMQKGIHTYDDGCREKTEDRTNQPNKDREEFDSSKTT